ncbi:MAG: prephenate dehydrogenase [Proteobacteria bacterium]|nr:prephenate dehydrogenase [Pseudomonadota bacterium]
MKASHMQLPREPAADTLATQTLCIVGCGLMGGSLALALRAQVARVHGVDPNPATRELALAGGLVDATYATLEEGVREAQLVVLAAPVRTNLALIAKLGTIVAPGTLLIDLSSTKTAMIAAMDALPVQVRAVGAHPMCGKEQAGVAHADGALFRGRVFVLCRSLRSDDAALALTERLVHAVGALPLLLDPQAHDHAVAHVSHLPYLLSVALVAACAELPRSARQVAASGFRDTSRLAASDPKMMADVLLTNREAVGEALQRARDALGRLADLLAPGAEAALETHLAAIQRQRPPSVPAKGQP